jgi:hypothetical protein
MAGMPLKAKRGFMEWFGLFLAGMTILSLPGWVRGVIGMVRETHWTAIFIPFWICLGYWWNSFLIKRWWNPDAYKIKW